jgi:7-cyano-7-deazaguanine reductase
MEVIRVQQEHTVKSNKRGMQMEFQALRPKSAASSKQLETFTKPDGVTVVTFTSNELTSLCPVTKQPDFSTVEIEYKPDTRCLESKSLKQYLWSFRDECAFCEALASTIAHDVYDATQPFACRVTIIQHVRGGIVTKAVAEVDRAQQ